MNSEIELHSGVMFDPLHPDPEKILLEDIEYSLMQQCRFSGHTSRFYSVVEHCLFVAEIVERYSVGSADNVILAALMHDATEAYMVDLPTPLKTSSVCDGYKEAEDRLLGIIASRFGFPFPLPDVVKLADAAALWLEASVLLPSGGRTWSNYESIGQHFINNHSDMLHFIQDGGQCQRAKASLFRAKVSDLVVNWKGDVYTWRSGEVAIA